MLEKAMSLSLNYLSYKSRTEFEVKKYLKNKGFDDCIIDQVISKLKEYRYIDDNEYIRNYHKSYTQNKGYGPLRIQYNLQQRGIRREKYLDIEQMEKTDYYSIALEQAKKKLKGKTDLNSLRKTYGYLLRRGFPVEIVSKVINKLKNNEELGIN